MNEEQSTLYDYYNYPIRGENMKVLEKIAELQRFIDSQWESLSSNEKSTVTLQLSKLTESYL